MAKVSVRRYAAMSDEIEQLDVELNELLSSVRNDIEGLEWDPKKSAMSGMEKKEEILRLKNQLDKAKGIFQNYKARLPPSGYPNLTVLQVEMRELDRDELRKYEGSARKHQTTLDELNRNLNYAKSLVEKAELMGDKGQNPPSAADGKNAKELIEMAKQTQATDVEAMMRMQRMINESEETGMETNIKLKTQTEQLKNIHADVHTVSSRMKTAEKLVNQIGRRLATDKLIACIILILLLLILAIVVVKALGLDQKGSTKVVGAGGYVYYVDCSFPMNAYLAQCRSEAQATPAPPPPPPPGAGPRQQMLQLADRMFQRKLEAEKAQ
ncbi:hypothetical protein GUITHDRAFT_165311 [Guillardia theta CCMP2712]|uniref:t-SNARE coiled-coil homology domain-containing protein n=1 Tax=Guillardia theta (strain CCMP2712) TaxID=905079 RepID=L1IQ99_GUITC|nr:hypothetical protein GUITHDRAFT_165311 [Guillardia theta CCMP2712]EKX38059.1 hypothetical protein GUITHDRAFT_165311 [Guillardia theta CCMP2712]|eukprot:XP_005825039.1 hypothetical protein GUITHDRAFT_165311 [Guillardia theta CCMP2712]